jgi:hypothetical protein
MKTKLITTIILIVLGYSTVIAQVAITTDGSLPDNSAMLDIKSSDKGILVPRMTEAERNAIGNPAKGLLVYVTTDEQFYYNSGSAASPNWVTIGGADDDWTVSGNNMKSSVSGNVGIGTFNAPNEKLQLFGGNFSISNEGTDAYIEIISDENSDATASYIWSEDAKGLAIGSTPGTPQVLVDAFTGNLGIGTDSPNEKLEVNGSIRMTDGNEGAGKIMVSDANGTASWQDISAADDNDWVVSGNDMHSTVSGNVGIGTTSPSQKLDVDGNIIANDDIIAQYGNSGHASFRFGDGQENSGFSSPGYNDVAIINNGTESVRIKSNGNVGIGTSSPSTALEVAGQVKIAGGSPGNGKVLTSDANGLASWEDITDGVLEIDDLADAKTDSSSIFLGHLSGNIDNGNNANTAIGYETLHYSTSGVHNTASGFKALWNNSSGSYNVAIGSRSLYLNRHRSNLIAIGDSALYRNGLGAPSSSIIGTINTAIGITALSHNSEGYCNTAIGFMCLRKNDYGHSNTAIGTKALFNNINGDYNVAIGDSALYGGTSYWNYNYNTAIGARALQHCMGGNNTAIGYHANTFGYSTNSTALGYDAQATSSNDVAIGNTSIDWIGGQVSWSTYSKMSGKSNIKEDVQGLDFIMDLRPITYYVDKDAIDKALGVVDSSDYKEKYDIEKIKQSGFIAEEVLQSSKKSNYEFSGISVLNEKEGLYSIAYAEFVVPLVKGMQEQQGIIESYEDRFTSQEKTIEKLIKRIEKLEKTSKN